MLKYFRYMSMLHMLLVVVTSLVLLLVVLLGVSIIESERGRPGPFDIVLYPIDAPLWELLAAGSLLVNGITMARWAMITAILGRRYAGYSLEIPFSIGKLVAANLFYIGAAVLLFFAVRCLGS